MAKKKASEDVIQRQLLLRYLARKKANCNLMLRGHRFERSVAVGVIDDVVAWVRGAAKRASKPGGIGRR